MKPTELMKGDWVIRKGIPQEPMKITGFNTWKNLVYLDLSGLAITEKLDNIEGIPLTEHILDINKFHKWEWNNHPKNNAVTYGIGDGFHVQVCGDGKFEIIDNPYEGDYGFSSNFICDVSYVHKLQNFINVSEIENAKEIIL